MMLVQAGKEYKEGEAVVKRTASLINFMWTDLLRDRDTIGLPLHQEKIGLTEVYTKALQEGDFKTASDTMIRYVEIREELVKRWLGLMLDAHNGVEGTPEYAKEYAHKVFDMPQDDPTYGDYKVARDIYESEGEGILRGSRLYTYGNTAELVDAAKQEGIAIMPLGAGGPGANLVAIHPEGVDKLKEFLERPETGIKELDEGRARTIIRGTGELKGYMEFKVGREPMQFNGFERVGMQNPAMSALATATEADVGLRGSSPIKSEMLSNGNIPGGIDFNPNNVSIDEQGDKVQINFSPSPLQNLNPESINGILPVIINISPLPSVLPLLGLEPQRDEEFEVSSLN